MITYFLYRISLFFTILQIWDKYDVILKINAQTNFACSSRELYDASIILVASIAYAQDTPYSEEYMRQHDGGDRAEYLQEMEHSDGSFYVPPAN
jgi:hypothetical protein